MLSHHSTGIVSSSQCLLRQENTAEGSICAIATDARNAFFGSNQFSRRGRGEINRIAASAELPFACSCLAEEILQNGISACSRDHRFSPVEQGELPFLEYSVDVLGEAETISSPDQLDVKRYGVIVSRGRKRGLLLPDLEGVDTVEDQIAIAARKAGISDHDFEQGVTLQRFEVVRHT